MKTLALYLVTAACEIGGCYALWAWLRLGRSLWWAVPGLVLLLLFAVLLTMAETRFAGRAYAAYGGVYIVASILWMQLVEKNSADRWDLAGGAICLLGAGLILFGRR